LNPQPPNYEDGALPLSYDAILAPVLRIELRPAGLEAAVLPLHQAGVGQRQRVVVRMVGLGARNRTEASASQAPRDTTSPRPEAGGCGRSAVLSRLSTKTSKLEAGAELNGLVRDMNPVSAPALLPATKELAPPVAPCNSRSAFVRTRFHVKHRAWPRLSRTRPHPNASEHAVLPLEFLRLVAQSRLQMRPRNQRPHGRHTP
jgi:hypothetical protein